jgi:murein DD-endopeptidase MepM/ murein hydrolase activator NlpD
VKVDPNRPPPTPAQKAHDGAKTAAKQLEAFFLRQMLSEARPQGGGGLDGGFAGDTFKQMLDDAIADKMSAAGGVGMSQMFAQQLDKGSEVAAPPSAPGTAIAPVIDPSIDGRGTPTGSAAEGRRGSIDAAMAGAPHFVLPVAGRPSSGYGLRADPIHGGTTTHPGLDLAAPVGAEVGAAAGGTVIHAGPAGTYGNLVTLRHANGFETRYAHLSAVDVAVGDTVQAGQDVGKVGTTGYSTGPHLHFEVRRDGQTIDPAPLLPLNRSAPRTTR